MRGASAGLVVGLAALCSASTIAASSADEETDTGLAIGPWIGYGEAGGTATTSQEQGDIIWSGTIPAEFDFGVVEGAPSTAAGSWEHWGDGLLELTAADGTPLDLNLQFAGAGEVGGTNSRLELSGTVTTTAQFGIGNTEAIPTLAVDIHSTTCNEAYGDWVYSFVSYFEDLSYQVDFNGYWVAFRDVEGVQDEVSEALAAIGVESTEGLGTRSPLVQMTAEVINAFNGMVDAFPVGWTAEAVIGMAAYTESLINIWRNMTECDKKLFGADNVETFLNGLTHVVQNLIIGAGSTGLDGATFEQLAHIGARSGAFGAGARNPGDAVKAEQAMIAAGEEILDANVTSDGEHIEANDDTSRVLTTGAAMGWDFRTSVGEFNAGRGYDTVFGDASQASGDQP